MSGLEFRTSHYLCTILLFPFIICESVFFSMGSKRMTKRGLSE